MPLDFPSSPTNGQVYGNYYYNSARGAWNALLPAATPNFFTNATLNTSTLVDATATASVTSVTPLIVKSLSGQTTNIQSWQESSTILAGINQYGGFYTTNRLTVGASTISTSAIAHINTINAGNVGLLVKGSTSQTANLQEWQNSSGTTVSYIAAGGSIYSPTGSQMGSSYNVFQNSAAVHPVVVVKGYASQTGDLQQWQSSTGAVLSKINSSGEIQVPRIGVGATMPTTTMLQSTASAVGNVPIVAQGAASQTANLQEWQNSSGTVLANVNSAGVLSLSSGGGELQVKAGPATDHAYIEFYARSATPTTRSAYFGYPSNGSNNLTIANQIASSSIVLSSAYVTTPNQPTFFAYQPESGTYFISSGVPIFTSTLINNGSNYNATTGIFTAPIAGVYQFNAMMLLRNNTGPGEMTLLKNGVNVVSRNLAYSLAGGSGTHDAVHVMVYLSLAANDNVKVSVSAATAGDWYFGGGLGWFSGRLVG